MNAMLVYTASSCGVSASGIRLTAPTVPWMVSSSVRPVKTRIVSCFSWAVSVPQDGMSLETGTFSGNQKLPVNRSHTSASLSSCTRFQLMAETRSISFIPSDTLDPISPQKLFADPALQTLPLGADNARNRDILCSRVAPDPKEDVLGRLQRP